MKKIIPQILLLLAGFFGCWALLSQVPWTKLLKVKEYKSELESSLGDIVWEDIAQNYYEIKDKDIVAPVDSILTTLCQNNDIEKDSIHLYIVSNQEINAFALPNNQLVVNTGLIQNCKNANELAGVIAHELAHITQDHVMQKLVQEIGLATLTSVATGGSDIGSIVHILSSSAFSREAEREADIKAIEYLTNANIPVEDMANFLYGLNSKGPDLPWLSTHPDSQQRALYIIEEGKRKQKKDFKAIAPISPETMKRIKEKLQEWHENE